MLVDECRLCEFHIEALSDSVLCKYNHEIEHRVTDRGNIIMCPKDINSKKKGFSLFR